MKRTRKEIRNEDKIKASLISSMRIPGHLDIIHNFRIFQNSRARPIVDDLFLLHDVKGPIFKTGR